MKTTVRTVRLTITIPGELHATLTRRAANDGRRSVSNLIVKLLSDSLKKSKEE